MTPDFQFKIVKQKLGAARVETMDFLAGEEPLEIRVKGKSVAVTMRTPGNDEELACGFLLSEGILHERSDVIEIGYCAAAREEATHNILNVFLAPAVAVDFEKLTRNVFASSSCGMCGKASIESVHQHFPPIKSAANISAEVLCRLPDLLRGGQDAFTQSGGLHAAGIFDLDGNLLVVREDVGRHNALDKVIGWGYLNRKLPFDQHVLMVSGRASFEIMQKALAAGIPIIAAVSAPSSLAVDFARESNQTLAGFLRGNTFNIYSAPERIR